MQSRMLNSELLLLIAWQFTQVTSNLSWNDKHQIRVVRVNLIIVDAAQLDTSHIERRCAPCVSQTSNLRSLNDKKTLSLDMRWH